MGTTSVRLYECDGPGCDEQTPMKPKHQWPESFIRITLRDVTGLCEVGAFHDPKCGLAWTAERFSLVGFPEGPKDELELVEE